MLMIAVKMPAKEQKEAMPTSLGRCSFATSTRFAVSFLSWCSSSLTPLLKASSSARQLVSFIPVVISAVFFLTESAKDVATPHRLKLGPIGSLPWRSCGCLSTDKLQCQMALTTEAVSFLLHSCWPTHFVSPKCCSGASFAWPCAAPRCLVYRNTRISNSKQFCRDK